jgi:hypothetical protein
MAGPPPASLRPARIAQDVGRGWINSHHAHESRRMCGPGYRADWVQPNSRGADIEGDAGAVV